jgi:threonine/homoserine/homoserine lactone efflux protein
MNIADISSYFMTGFVLVIAPGPVILMLLVRAASSDLSGALSFGLGYTIGGLIIISVVCFGLSAWLTSAPLVFEYSKYAMMAYILWLARDIWNGGFVLTGECVVAKRSMFRSIVAGIMTCTISPYMMILLPLVLPELMNITTIQMPDFLIIALTTFAAFMIGVGLTIGFASQLRKLVRSPKHVTTVNRSLSSILVIGGGLMALS